VGTGESLNEIPVGIEWPEQSERFARLKESVTLIQQLFREDFVSFEGEYYRTYNATIYDKPEEPVPIYIAASGPAAARLAGRIADGLICTSGKGPELYVDTLLPAVLEGAEKAGPRCDHARSDDRDEGQLRHRPGAGHGGHQDLVGTGALRRAEGRCRRPARDGTAGDDGRGFAHRRWLVSSDPDEHVEQIATYVDYGFDHLVFHFPGNDQEAAIARYES
jgi:coenzyme F420-dependent glucose-6-phosphate dehydrogenase